MGHCAPSDLRLPAGYVYHAGPSRSYQQKGACFMRSIAILVAACGLLLGQPASATVVQVQTVLGDFQINLFDRTTPQTVANFLAYVNANAYTNNVVHRSEPGFVIQGGGFSYPGTLPLVPVAQNAMVANEPVYSNVRGTISMAKLASNPNSATNQWFISLADNSANLDVQNGGFTVFGQVTGNGMAIVDAIAALSRFNMGGEFTAVPLRNFTAADANAGTAPNDNNLVLIRSVIVLDANPDSAASLTPARNTLIAAPPPSGGSSGGGDSGGGGGSVGLASLLALGLLALARRSFTRTTRC
jgi:peptidyl-prolyl cis-trans isomerase A (cyclophilin A)